MNSISKESGLIFLAAYQNQGTLRDYLDPWIAMWTDEFIATGLSYSLHQKIILEAGFDEDELSEVVQVQAGIKGSFGFEKELLEEWTTWIMKDQKRKEIVKDELMKYFYWQGKPFWEGENEAPWITGDDDMPKTPEEALEWFNEIFRNPSNPYK